ncbi:MAG: serine/threonine-protein kinase, partial [Thermoanaerobaculia bacterium]
MSDEIGHYRIKQKLGSGGMGDVYLAEDLRLHRLVALKVLPADVARDPQRRTRFIQEAHAASVLSHPNVSTIHEVGEDGDTVFISMEYIDGKTLTQVREGRTLAVDEVVDIALQAADALDEAQARGIVHRDIKSANIMLTASGHVKVLDFGLAKMTSPAMETSEETKIKTGAGIIVGTPYYMSPEQALGRAVDHRSDLFSLGVVLYELVTGKLPFVGTTTTETIDKITHADPDPMARFNYSLPQELERIIRKLLEKEPARRYQAARDLIVDLKNLKRDTTSGEVVSSRPANPRRRWPLAAAVAVTVVIALVALSMTMGKRPRNVARAGAAEAIDSIAVLPFVNASRNADNEYLSDGISETIINDLSRIGGLRVVPRGTVFQFKGQQADLQKVAETLNVRAIVTGRVLQRGDLLSVQAELIDTESNAQLWGARYERKVSDALALQQEISRQISERIRSKGEAAAPVRTAGAMTRDPEAYQLYLKGRYHWNKRTGESVEKALDYFQQTVARDPGFALGHIGVADSYLVLEQYGDRSGPEMTAKA